jgi:hypothetical protein
MYTLFPHMVSVPKQSTLLVLHCSETSIVPLLFESGNNVQKSDTQPNAVEGLPPHVLRCTSFIGSHFYSKEPLRSLPLTPCIDPPYSCLLEREFQYLKSPGAGLPLCPRAIRPLLLMMASSIRRPKDAPCGC